MPLTVVQFWQQERDIYEQEQTAAQSGMTAAQAALGSAKAALTAHVASFSAVGAQIQAARAQLATTAVPADASALNTHIRDLIVQQRGLQGTVLDDHDAIDWAQADLDAATMTLTRATARLADAAAKLAAAQTDDLQRQGMHAALLLAPFDTLNTDANTLLTGATKTNADTAISASFPTELVTIAGLRATRRSQFVHDRNEGVSLAEQALGAAWAADDGLDGVAAQAGVAFRQADRTVRDYAASATIRFDKARAILSTLETIALHPGTVAPLLSDAQKAEIADAGQLAARQTAESHAVGIDTARQTVATAQKTLDAQILTAIHDDVDTLGTDATVASTRAALEAARVALKGNQDAFVADDKATLDDWQVVVSDGAWQTLLDYLTAVADITELKDIKIQPAGDADSLLKIVDDAEQAYGDALAAAAKARRRADYLADQVALRQERLDAATSAYTARALSAVRGDSF
jgi:hypothetical protein